MPLARAGFLLRFQGFLECRSRCPPVLWCDLYSVVVYLTSYGMWGAMVDPEVDFTPVAAGGHE